MITGIGRSDFICFIGWSGFISGRNLLLERGETTWGEGRRGLWRDYKIVAARTYRGS